ncbi:MAG: ABC transporter ATP-binding protein [Clostridia bacterium]|nr:ABC transporter ATP-binding protein [Clostridia bacterium]
MSLCINRLTKAFDGRTVIKDFSYNFPACGLFSLVGKSGEGKTTLLRMIASLTRPDSGTITGHASVSVAFQEYRLIEHLNAIQNLTFVLYKDPKANEERASRMLADLQLTAQEQHLLPRQLSGGMKQRVSLARAFLHDAPILLLDEPFKELDPALCALVLERIREESTRRLVLLTVHSAEDAERYGATPVYLS